MAFLSVITRTMASRPTMLERNKQSLRDQTCQDFEHLVHVDEQARGNFWAQRWVTDLVHEAQGDYIMILDDDDLMRNPKGVAILKDCCKEKPRGVIFQADYGPGRILPETVDGFDMGRYFWSMNHIGQLCYILRNDIFKESCYVYRRGVDETDYLALLDAYENAKGADALGEFVLRWEIINAAQRADSRGKPE
jgi:hypothetical protein